MDPSQSKWWTSVPLDFCVLNSQSVCNKSWLLNDFIADYNIDLFALTETFVAMTRIYTPSMTFLQMDMFFTMYLDYIPVMAGWILFSRIISESKFKHMSPTALFNILSWYSELWSALPISSSCTILLHLMCHCFLMSLLTILPT